MFILILIKVVKPLIHMFRPLLIFILKKKNKQNNKTTQKKQKLFERKKVIHLSVR